MASSASTDGGDSDDEAQLGTHISDDEAAGKRSRREQALRNVDPEKQQKFAHAHLQEVHTIAPDGGYMGRNFHGAFTGGFSAGYYNSVGSAEGWQPSEWRSSRGERSPTSSFPMRTSDSLCRESKAAAALATPSSHPTSRLDRMSFDVLSSSPSTQLQPTPPHAGEVRLPHAALPRSLHTEAKCGSSAGGGGASA